MFITGHPKTYVLTVACYWIMPSAAWIRAPFTIKNQPATNARYTAILPK